ncbi:hypothetical protein ABZ896_32300 [Streptomyces sp. NPDC047072]|uniref:hypothetical protein n=1 Tax=Streptomyces sp. NPDC047072 TaxID=3154809 RepID=UPI0033C2EF39
MPGDAGAPPAWASAETQAALNSPWASGDTTPPPPWATAETSTSAVLPEPGGRSPSPAGSPWASAGSVTPPHDSGGSPHPSVFARGGTPHPSTSSPYAADGSAHNRANSPYISGGSAGLPAASPYASGGSAGLSANSPYAPGGSAGLSVLVAVLVGVVVGVGVWFLIRDSSGGRRAGAGPVVGGTVTGAGAAGSRTGASVGASASADASASASVPRPTGSGTALTPSARPSQGSSGSGYRRTQDPVGYAIDVPVGWTRTEKQGQLAPVVSFDAPEDGRRLQVFRLAEETPAASLDLAENAPGYGFSAQPGYRVLDRTSGTSWAELAYRYDDPDLGPRQVIDHRFEAADGTLYAIRSTGPESLAPTLLRTPLTRALMSFCPTGTECA